jgi:hypothetical protein
MKASIDQKLKFLTDKDFAFQTDEIIEEQKKITGLQKKK